MFKSGTKIDQFVDNGRTISLADMEGFIGGSSSVKAVDITYRSSEIFKGTERNFKEKDYAVCKWLHSEDVADRVEKKVITDGKGNIISIGEGVIGSVGFTNTEGEIKAFRKAKNRSLVTYHNHHWNSNFSAEDIEVLLTQSKIGESVIVCNNKNIYRLSCNKIFDNLENKVKIEYDKYYSIYKGDRQKVVQELCKIFWLKYSEGVI